ncbi:hypothetical protein BJX99DRAFT_225512 [Aspergillus californicus]
MYFTCLTQPQPASITHLSCFLRLTHLSSAALQSLLAFFLLIHSIFSFCFVLPKRLKRGWFGYLVFSVC